MKLEKELSIGAFLGTVGSVGIIISILFGAPDLARPWSFLVGFTVGVVTGIGVVLSLHGLIERRRGKELHGTG